MEKIAVAPRADKGLHVAQKKVEGAEGAFFFFRWKVLLGKVDVGFRFRGELQEAFDEVVDRPADGTGKLAAGRQQGPVGAGADKFQDSLGLTKVEAAVKKGAAGELARFSEAASAGEKIVEDFPDEEGTAVGGQFEQRFARVGATFGEPGEKELVKDLSFVVTVVGKGRPAGWGRFACPEDFPQQAGNFGTGDPEERNGRFPGGGGGSGDGVGGIHITAIFTTKGAKSILQKKGNGWLHSLCGMLGFSSSLFPEASLRQGSGPNRFPLAPA